MLVSPRLRTELASDRQCLNTDTHRRDPAQQGATSRYKWACVETAPQETVSPKHAAPLLHGAPQSSANECMCIHHDPLPHPPYGGPFDTLRVC